MRRHTLLLSASAFLLSLASFAVTPIDPVAIMAEFDHISATPLWRGFDPQQVPIEIYDGRQTWLFRHPHPPEGFVESPQHKGLFLFSGMHPSVRANSSTQLGGAETATAVLDKRSGRSDHELAALAMHEAFHVFERQHHPNWQANEADFFMYPVDNFSLLQYRFAETESLRRALLARDVNESACWAAEALRFRNRRFGGLDAVATAFERGTELNEGLATYIQVRAAGSASSFSLPQNDFAAEAVRDRAYKVGAALALLLDRIANGWQAELNAGASNSLDELLAAKTYFAAPTCSFSDTENASLLARARSAVTALKDRRAQFKADFSAAKGKQLIISSSTPLQVEGFDPSNLVELGNGELLHRRWIKLKVQDGDIEVLDRAALTEPAGKHPLMDGVREITVSGIPDNPKIVPNGDSVEITCDGVHASFKHANIRTVGEKTLVQIEPDPAANPGTPSH